MPVFEVTSPDGRTFEVTAPEGATQAEVLSYAQKNYAQPTPAAPSAPTKPKTFMESATEAGRDFLAGGVRGAGSIGATLLTPIDAAARAVGVQNDFIGRTDRRQAMDGGLRELGADTDSTAFSAGKLGAEIAGTAGAGGVLANGVRAVGGARALIGLEPIIDGVARGLQTGGFRVGPLAGTGLGTATRVATGSATGGAVAGLVNPSDAGFGAAIGGVLPGATALAGRAGVALRGKVTGNGVTPETIDTARRAMDAGYIIPPSQVNPSFANRTIESLSGKFETAQMAATKNQEVTNSLVRKSLGLAPDAPLTKEAMQTYRNLQHQTGYEPLRNFGMLQAGPKFNDALDDIVKKFTGKGTIPAIGKEKQQIAELVNSHKSVGFDSGDAIDAIRTLRESADEAFGKGDKAVGKTYRAIAEAYESAIEDGLQTIKRPDMLKAYRTARQNIAKSHTVEKGLREGAGTVDARTLGRELQKGKPLSGELRQAAEFGNTFNKAAQPPHLIGSPGVNALKPIGSMVASGLGGVALGPAGLALGALNYAVPPLARARMFSKAAQRGLLGSGTAVVGDAAPVGLLTQGAYRAFPLLSGQ